MYVNTSVHNITIFGYTFSHHMHDRAWRHWGCTTPAIITNMKKSFSNADELDGFEDLQPADQEKIRQAWDDGHVADEDIPETARKPKGDDEADEPKPKKKRASTKKDDAGEEAKPKKARTSKKVSRYCPSPFTSGLLISSLFTED